MFSDGIIKHCLAGQKSVIAAVCCLYALFFAASGCKKDDVVRQPYCYILVEGELKKYHLSVHTGVALLEVRKPLPPNDPKLPDEIAKLGMTISGSGTGSGGFECYDFFYDEYDRCWARLFINKNMNEKQLVKMLADINRENSDLIIGPCFDVPGAAMSSEHFGVCYAFVVCLKTEVDGELLRQMAERTGCKIVEEYSPLCFSVCVTGESKLNGLECANIFIETGLFQNVGYKRLTWHY